MSGTAQEISESKPGEPLQYESFEEGFYRVYHKEFISLLRTEVLDLCSMCQQLLLAQKEKPEEISLNSGGVYRFMMECTRCEDILDQVHAEQEENWTYIRKLVAVIKHSCSITANLQLLAVLAEKLADSVEGKFSMATEFVMWHFHRVLLESAQNFLNETRRLGVLEDDYQLSLVYDKYFIPDIKPLMRLRASASSSFQPKSEEVTATQVQRTQEHALYLVSTLLHDCDVIQYLGRLQDVKMSRRQDIIADDLHEETLTAQRELFHSIITYFDTQCAQRQIVTDPEIIDLINHVKVVHQLFKGFSALMRIEERHYHFFVEHNIKITLNDDKIHGIIFDFFINYIDRFRLQIEKISKYLIRKYSEQKTISLPIPGYRGFHVRPSTLVARIVMHYGSNVQMHLKDTSYNTAVPLDLFRANEVINAEKRRGIGKIIAESKECQGYTKLLRRVEKYREIGKIGTAGEENQEDLLHNNSESNQISMQKYFLELFQSFQKQEKIVVYEMLSMEALEMPSPGEEFLEYVKREVAYLMATGKIDIASDLKVTFEGDSRVLADIAVLAENGYGEDKSGNNIALPKELSYLRR